MTADMHVCFTHTMPKVDQSRLQVKVGFGKKEREVHEVVTL